MGDWAPELYYYIPTFRRHHVVVNTLRLLAILAEKNDLRVEVLLVDATEAAIDESLLPETTDFFCVTYFHSSGILSYEAGAFLDGRIDPNVPIFYGADDELGFVTKADLRDFVSSSFEIGVPQYAMVKQEHNDFVQIYNGWTQCRDLCFVEDPLTRLSVFADQGVILHYALFDGSFFRDHYAFILKVLELLNNMEEGLERFCEPLFSLTTILARNCFLKSSGYLRRVDRRPAQVSKHRHRFVDKPVYPWILLPRLKDQYPDEFGEIVAHIAEHWSRLTGMEVNEVFVDGALEAYATGYKNATSRSWREGYEFVYRRPNTSKENPFQFSRIASKTDSDYFYYVLNQQLNMTEIERIKFRYCWVTHPMLRILFTLKSDSLFQDEDANLN